MKYIIISLLLIMIPSVALSESTVSQDLIEESIEYLEKDYPNVNWSKAPSIQCFTSNYDKYKFDTLGIIAYYRPSSNTLRMSCSKRISHKQKLVGITHELIHWYQYRVVGRDNYGCIGAIEAEAYSFNIRHFGLGSFGIGVFQWPVHRNLKHMADCRPIGGKQSSPWY